MTKKRTPVSAGARRPWMLGTNDRPPPLRVPWQMWSRSSDPHQQGLVQFEFTDEGLGVGWWPEAIRDKDVIPWHELAWMAGREHPDLARERELVIEAFQMEGFRLGLKKAVEALQAKVLAIKADGEENPFLKKYAVDLGRAVDEVQAIIANLRG